MAEATEWFHGSEGRSDDEVAYLLAVRQLAAGHAWPLKPQDTRCMTFDVPLYLAAAIPSLSRFPGQRAARDLEVSLWPPDSARGLRLDGLWGDSARPMDDVWLIEGGALEVIGVRADPKQLARWTVEWIATQLERRLVRRTWLTGGQDVVTEDTQEHVAISGGPWRRIGDPATTQTFSAGTAQAP